MNEELADNAASGTGDLRESDDFNSRQKALHTHQDVQLKRLAQEFDLLCYIHIALVYCLE
jgi:hypothetical protein